MITFIIDGIYLYSKKNNFYLISRIIHKNSYFEMNVKNLTKNTTFRKLIDNLTFKPQKTIFVTKDNLHFRKLMGLKLDD